MSEEVLRDPRVGLACDVLGIGMAEVVWRDVRRNASVRRHPRDQRDECLRRGRLEA